MEHAVDVPARRRPSRVAVLLVTLVLLAGLLLVEASRQGQRELERCQKSAPAVDDLSMVEWRVASDYSRLQVECTLENDAGNALHWHIPVWQWPP